MAALRGVSAARSAVLVAPVVLLTQLAYTPLCVLIALVYISEE